MKIKYLSDIHNDSRGGNFLLSLTPDPEAVLVVAGDINSKGRTVRDLEEVSDNWKAIVAVCGNHDFWGLSLYDKHKFATTLPNVHILQNDYVKIDDVVFCGTTLWHEVWAEEYWWKQTMMDARKIRGYNYSRLKANDIDMAHMEACNFIEKCQEVFSEEKKILITHHSLCHKSVHEMYKGQSSNKYYYTEHPELLEGFRYHFHGHMHSSSDYEVFGCNVLCNPVGYLGERTEWEALKEVKLCHTKNQ